MTEVPCDSFLTNVKTSQFAWNSPSIDNTDIQQCIAALGRKFEFPLDIELHNNSTNSALFTYLRHVSCDTKFSQAILFILIEEDRAYHQDRMNTSKNAIKFKVGDALKLTFKSHPTWIRAQLRNFPIKHLNPLSAPKSSIMSPMKFADTIT